MNEQTKELQQEIAKQVKLVNFLRNAPDVTDDQLRKVQQLLAEANQVLKDSLKLD